MARKEIAIQPGETRALKNVAEELKILEGIKHQNLVRYYGIEVHRVSFFKFLKSLKSYQDFPAKTIGRAAYLHGALR